MITPTLVTARLTLGPVSQAHTEAFIDFCSTDYSRFMGGPSDRSDAWRSVAMHTGQWVLRGYGTFWLTDRASGQPVGRVGIWHPDGRDEPELSWVIYQAHEAKGLGEEAALAARKWAYQVAGLPPVMSLIDPANTRSVRLAERLGATLEGTRAYDDGKTILCYRHPGPEPLA